MLPQQWGLTSRSSGILLPTRCEIPFVLPCQHPTSPPLLRLVLSSPTTTSLFPPVTRAHCHLQISDPPPRLHLTHVKPSFVDLSFNQPPPTPRLGLCLLLETGSLVDDLFSIASPLSGSRQRVSHHHAVLFTGGATTATRQHQVSVSNRWSHLPRELRLSAKRRSSSSS